MRKILYLIPVTITLLITCKPSNRVIARDDFEADSLSSIWRTDKFIPGALVLQSDIVRTGSKACRLTLHPGDQIDEETGTKFERAELREPKNLMATEGINYSYSFSLFLPADFPVVPTRLVVAQWKQNCQDEKCDPDNPVVAVRFDYGVLRITLQVGPERLTLYEQSENNLGHWLDFKFSLRFSRRNDGQLNVWLNKKEIINYKGITAYSKSYGYPEPGQFYFKTGLYRDQMDQTMTIFIDDYLKEELKHLK
jgi:hypothetical protein